VKPSRLSRIPAASITETNCPHRQRPLRESPGDLLPERDGAHLLLKREKLPDIRFHDLRHTSATLLLSAGVHPKIVQERLGHSQIGVTMDIYSHVLPSMQQEAAGKLDKVLAAAAG
jgi:integrase